MPVSTRSQASADRKDQSTRATGQEGAARRALLQNPHHGLKEKMRALTLLYEQQKQQCAALNGGEVVSVRSSSNAAAGAKIIATHHPSIDLLSCSNRKKEEEQQQQQKADNGGVQAEMKENIALPSPLLRAAVSTNHAAFPAKENDIKNSAFSCPTKKTTTAAARKLSLGGLGVQAEARFGRSKAVGEANPEDAEPGSRILVFVRLRPMSRKEKEAGSRSCVKIVNKKDVYLTELATETDYLRLKRVRGRHFCFDASFPDSTAQQEVYATT